MAVLLKETKERLMETIEKSIYVVECGDMRDLRDFAELARSSMAAAYDLIRYLEMERDAQDLVIESLRPRWVSVGERMPKTNGEVLVFSEYGVGLGYCSLAGHLVDYVNNVEDEITHWMPLPEPPEEKQ